MKARDIEKKLAKSGFTAVDYTARNKKSRRRGYAFENNLVKDVSRYAYWGSRRLGGSSTGLPDVMMSFAELVPANDKEDPELKKWKTIIIATECKEGEDNYLYVEREQIKRCFAAITALWQSIDNKWILLAFKFLRNQTKYKTRTKTVFRYVLIPYHFIGEWLKHNYNFDYRQIYFRYDINKEELAILQQDTRTGNKATIVYKRKQGMSHFDNMLNPDDPNYQVFDNVAELIGYLEHV